MDDQCLSQWLLVPGTSCFPTRLSVAQVYFIFSILFPQHHQTNSNGCTKGLIDICLKEIKNLMHHIINT